MDRFALQDYLSVNKCTLLGVGPVSKNCVDAVIELADAYDIPLILIASRNQIESEDFGGGYVHNWTTQGFADYVRKNDKSRKIILARDHGGPWQNQVEKEKRLSLTDAIESAKRSYKADIDAGFDILHIDPSIDIHKNPTIDQIIERVFELYEFCIEYSHRAGKEIIFEIGTEEQSGFLNTNENLKYILNRVKTYCDKNNIPEPSFIVVQTGTKVKEMENIGRFETLFDGASSKIDLKNVIETISICNEANIMMKVHNMDYLSHQALEMHTRLGIQTANVAPEFGVTESKAFLSILNKYSMPELANQFLEISYQSGKWKKWMLENSIASDFDRAVISGHYVFSTRSFKQIKERAENKLDRLNIKLDNLLKDEVKKQIYRYLKAFCMIN